MGAAVRQPDGTYQVITGNQIAAILLDYLLFAHQKAGTLPANAAAVKSIVSSELPTVIAEHYGAKMVNVLTGFKFIAEQIKNYEETNAHTFMFGFEESYGYLVQPFVRDKDAIQAVLLLTEVAAHFKSEGKTLYDGLQALYEKYGYFLEKTISVTVQGLEGPAKIKALLDGLRKEVPSNFGGIKVALAQDFAVNQQVDAEGIVSEIGLPTSNVLKYILEELGEQDIPVKKSWRLNERHYGALQGLNKDETKEKYGEEQVLLWRRSTDVRPPALSKDDERYPGNDPKYSDLKENELPTTENLIDTIERVMEYWNSDIKKDLEAGKRVIIAAHGNSLRGLIKYLDNMTDEEIIKLELQTGNPICYELDDNLKPIRHYYLK